MGVLTTVMTGLTILATGKTFTHGLGTLPDFITVTPKQTSTNQCFVITFGATTVTIAGPIDGLTVDVLVQRLHTIIQ